MWTLPVEPIGESGIGFAPNLTENAFADLPPLVDAPDMPASPCESFIFASDESSLAPARRSVHTRKKSDNHIPRPPNAFILFRSSFIKSQRVSTEVETNHSTLSKIIGMTWKNLPPDERHIWHTKAMDAVAEHKRNFPEYAFRPKHSRGKKNPDAPPPKAKRKVREVYQDPVRCEKIAELLVEGKKGAELDRAIQEFDKHHVPEIVTRFEAPITERAYRRSSSVPAPNSDDSRAFLSSSPASVVNSSRRRRSSSVGAETRASQGQAKLQKMRSASIFIDTDCASVSDGQLTPLSFDSFSFQSKTEPDLDTFVSILLFYAHCLSAYHASPIGLQLLLLLQRLLTWTLFWLRSINDTLLPIRVVHLRPQTRAILARRLHPRRANGHLRVHRQRVAPAWRLRKPLRRLPIHRLFRARVCVPRARLHGN